MTFEDCKNAKSCGKDLCMPEFCHQFDPIQKTNADQSKGMREKLVALLIESPGLATLSGKLEEYAENADWLIANGVTIPVRCKLCCFSKYFEESGTRKCTTQKGLCRTVADDEFCSYGERRTDG